MKHLWDTFKIEEFNLVNIRMRVRLSKNSLQTVDEVIGLCNWTNNSDNWVTQITQLWFGNYLNVCFCCARHLMISGDRAGMAVPVTRQTLKKCNFQMVKSFEQSKIEMNQFLIEWHISSVLPIRVGNISITLQFPLLHLNWRQFFFLRDFLNFIWDWDD